MEPIGISEARARLLELASRVANRRGDVIVIENRRRGERVVLTAEAYLRSLEAVVSESQKQGAAAFELEGSITSDLSAEALAEAIRSLRQAHDAGDLARLADLVS